MRNLQNIFMEHLYLIPNDFWHKRKIYNFDPYNVFLAIARNIPQRLKTGFVVQGHIFRFYSCSISFSKNYFIILLLYLLLSFVYLFTTFFEVLLFKILDIKRHCNTLVWFRNKSQESVFISQSTECLKTLWCTASERRNKHKFIKNTVEGKKHRPNEKPAEWLLLSTCTSLLFLLENWHV